MKTSIGELTIDIVMSGYRLHRPALPKGRRGSNWKVWYADMFKLSLDRSLAQLHPS